jgi:hypothetical protein
MSDRFEHVETFERRGQKVAKIRDTSAGRDHYICLISPKHLTVAHWDRLKAPVAQKELRRFALSNLAPPRRDQIGNDHKLLTLAAEGRSPEDIATELGYARPDSVVRRLRRLEDLAGAA